MTDQDNGADLDGTITWRALLAETSLLLEQSCAADNPKLEARWIVEEVTGTTGTDFHEALDDFATTRGVAKLDALVSRRRAGEPIQYVLGHWQFRSVDLLIDQRVLIPRPETELVAGLAIDELIRMRPHGGGTVIDMGTGSGAIGLSIAAEQPGTRVLLTDASKDALAVARANLVGLGSVARGVEISCGSWFDAVPDHYRGECDVIVSNPPYIGTDEELPCSVVDWEPESALRAGNDGLKDLQHIVEHASTWLRSNGSLVLEMAHTQTSTIAAQGASLGYVAKIHCDLAGLDRVVVLQRG